jgi:isoamylase
LGRRALAGDAGPAICWVGSNDGYTLYDQVAYDNDGQTSGNCGMEGDAGVTAGVVALRRRQVRNFLTLLMMSNGAVVGDTDI